MNNKTITGIVVAVLVVGVLGFLYMSKYQTANVKPNPTAPSPVVTANTVQIQNFSFSPAILTVKVGDKVTWTNNDSIGHTVTADDSSFDTGVISPGQSGIVTFNKAGTIGYHCSIHPSMKGTVIVQ